MRMLISFAAIFLSIVLLQLGAGGIAPLDALSGAALHFPKSLIGLMGSLLGDRATWVSAGVAGTAAVAAFALPYKLHIVVAVAAAVAAGLLMEGPGSGLGRPLRLFGARDRQTT